MTGEWIGIVSTGVVGIAGIASTIWVQRQERKNSWKLFGAERSHDRRQVAYERLIVQAIEVTEFVTYADLIFVRDAQPPDVDIESYDAWMLLHLYATDTFKSAYGQWLSKVEEARDLLEEVPEGTRWFDMEDDTPDRFRELSDDIREALDTLRNTAKAELMQA